MRSGDSATTPAVDNDRSTSQAPLAGRASDARETREREEYTPMSGRMGDMLRGLDAWLTREEPDVCADGAAEGAAEDADEGDSEGDEDDGASFTPAATAH